MIMDGNGRWATQRGLPRLVGHRKGAERVREIVTACPQLGITHLTVYAFSTENWKRGAAEVLGLMSIFARYIESEAEKLATAGVRLRFIGDRTRLEPKLQKLMAGIEARTAQCSALPPLAPVDITLGSQPACSSCCTWSALLDSTERWRAVRLCMSRMSRTAALLARARASADLQRALRVGYRSRAAYKLI
jgi:hypothetical protein